MKSFKKFVAEVAQPKPEEEKRFKDQHTYEVIKHPVATDAQFTGDIDKPKAKRIADQEGDANYDKAVKNPERRMAAESVETNLTEEDNGRFAFDMKSKEHMNAAKKDLKAAGMSSRNRPGHTGGDHALHVKGSAQAIHKVMKKHADNMHDANMGSHHDMNDDTYGHRLGESVEQIDEISKELAAKYLKSAPARAADAGEKHARAADAYDKEQGKKDRKKSIRKFLNTQTGVARATNRLMKKESNADDRARYDAADDKDKKKVTLPKAPWDKKDEELSPKQKKIDRNKNGKIDGHDLAMLRKKKNEEVELDETTSSAIKKMVTQTGPDGKTRTVMKKAKIDKTDDHGQDQITTKESVKMIDEAMKMKRGPMRLKDGSQIMVSKEDADLLNRMFKDLSSNNQRQMQKVMMMDKAGYEEISGFAREAL